jgi:hypothetical protein
VVQVGNAYRVLPIRNPRKDREYLVDTERSMEVMTKKFKYRGLDDPKVYYTDDYRGSVLNTRSSFNSVAQAMVDKGDLTGAKELIMFSLTKMPDKAIRYDQTMVETIDLLFRVGEKDKAIEISKTLGDRSVEMANYLVGESTSLTGDLRTSIVVLNILQRTLYEHGENELAKKYEDAYTRLISTLQIYEEGSRSDR